MRMKSSTEYTVEGDSAVTSCVCAKDSVTNDFTIRLNEIGFTNLTISVCTSSSAIIIIIIRLQSSNLDILVVVLLLIATMNPTQNMDNFTFTVQCLSHTTVFLPNIVGWM